MAQAVSRRPLTAAAWVRAQVNPVGFVVEKVAQVFLRVLRFSAANIIPPWAPHFRKLKKKVLSFIRPLHSSSSGDGQKARESGRSPVRRQSYPHNHNTRNMYIQTVPKRCIHIIIRNINLVYTSFWDTLYIVPLIRGTYPPSFDHYNNIL
jgi:hypothetical protein